MNIFEKLTILVLVLAAAYLLLNTSYYAASQRRYSMSLVTATLGWGLGAVAVIYLIITVWEAR